MISSHNLNTSGFFEGRSDKAVARLVTQPFDISQASRIVNLSQKMPGFSKLSFIFIFLDNTSHKF